MSRCRASQDLSNRNPLWKSPRATPYTRLQPREAQIGVLRRLLKSLFKVAVRWGYVAGNPTADIKQSKETPKHTRHLTAEQLARLMQVLKSRGGRAYDVALMMAETGLRLGTVRQLQWGQVDFEQGVLFIPKTKNHDSLEVPIGKMLYAHLQRLYGQRQSTNLVPLSRGQDWVFPSPADPTKPFHTIRKSLIAAAPRGWHWARPPPHVSHLFDHWHGQCQG